MRERAARLPTAAALALALAGFGCSLPVEEAARPDPVTVKHPTPTVASTAPSTPTGPGLQAIDPDPRPLPGEAAIVTPVPTVTPVPSVKAVMTAKPYVPGVAPSGVHRTAGKPAIVRPTI